jgi:hypothetical protein
MEKQPKPDDKYKAPDTEGQLQAGEAASKPSQADVDKDDEDEPPRRARPRTILIAVGVGIVATIVLLVFVITDRLTTFEGADRISDLLDSANNLNGDEFEPVETTAGDLEDWFFLKHGLEHYAVPKQFADLKTVGCRIFKFNGATVAQIEAISERKLLLYLFPADDLGIKVGNRHWEIVEADNWVGGLTGANDTCFVVAFQGTKGEMKEFLTQRGK